MTRIIVDITKHNGSFILDRLKYVCNFIQVHPLFPKNMEISLGKPEEGAININYSEIRQEGSFNIMPISKLLVNKNVEIPTLDWQKIRIGESFVFGLGNASNDSENPLDIFESIFFHISRYEEWVVKNTDLDAYGMMKSRAQVLVKNKMEKSPVVDQLVVYFLQNLGINVDSKPSLLSLSHDIDAIQKFTSFYKFLRSFGNIWMTRKNKFRSSLRLMKSYIDVRFKNKKDPFDTFEWLIRNDGRFESKTIYFLSGGKTKYDGFYDIQSEEAKSIIKKSMNMGYKIGLHPSFDSYKKKSIMADEKAALENASDIEITDSRQHFLRFTFPETSKIIDGLGLKTDSSLGYRDRIGYRCGTGFGYNLYDFESEKAYTFKEYPLVIMDGAAMNEVNGNVNLFKNLIRDFMVSNSENTHIHFNFHNSFFDSAIVDSESLKSFYLSL